MTYTFKLARRLAVSRTTVLPVLLVVAACSGSDTMAPPADLPESGIYGWRPRESTPVEVRINPSTVTVETNQLIQFKARGRNRAGDDIVAPVTWSTTGGTILPDGRFSAAAIGTYRVMGRTRTRDDVFAVDTSMVIVIRRPLNLLKIEITPDSATLTTRVGQSFSVVGRLSSGQIVPVGVNWTATGGTIDPAGNYVAGDTAGTYRVIARNTAGTLADTAVITIAPLPSLPPSDSGAPTPPTIPVTPAPPPAPEPPTEPDPPAPPAPVLEKVTLVPASVTLATGATKTFSAFGRTTAGDSVGVNVTFSATGGSVSSLGVYKAGATAGTFRVIATANGLADTSTVSITRPLGSGTGLGIPFGMANMLNAGAAPGPYTMSFDAYSATTIVSKLDEARSKRLHVILALTGGKHENYMTNGVFDRAKWNAKMETFNTASIRQAIADAVADGTIVGNSVMDEPQVHGIGADANTWGPSGTMTKARVDSMCGYVKDIFPTLPTGVTHRHSAFQPTKSYRVCDFIVSQYSAAVGDVTAFRDEGLAIAQRDGHAILFSMNALNGGTQDRDGTWDCSGTGGLGQDAPNCRMSAEQLRNWGLILGPAGCGLNMWRYDQSFYANSGNQAASREVAGVLATLPSKACRRQ